MKLLLDQGRPAPARRSCARRGSMRSTRGKSAWPRRPTMRFCAERRSKTAWWSLWTRIFTPFWRSHRPASLPSSGFALKACGRRNSAASCEMLSSSAWQTWPKARCSRCRRIESAFAACQLPDPGLSLTATVASPRGRTAAGCWSPPDRSLAPCCSWVGPAHRPACPTGPLTFLWNQAEAAQLRRSAMFIATDSRARRPSSVRSDRRGFEMRWAREVPLQCRS